VPTNSEFAIEREVLLNLQRTSTGAPHKQRETAVTAQNPDAAAEPTPSLFVTPLDHTPRRFRQCFDLFHMQLLQWQLDQRCERPHSRKGSAPHSLAIAVRVSPSAFMRVHGAHLLCCRHAQTAAVGELADLVAAARLCITEAYSCHFETTDIAAWPDCLLDNNPSAEEHHKSLNLPTSLTMLLDAAVGTDDSQGIGAAHACELALSVRELFIELFELCLLRFALRHCSNVVAGSDDSDTVSGVSFVPGSVICIQDDGFVEISFL